MEVRLLFNRLFSDPFHCIAELLFLLMLLRGPLFVHADDEYLLFHENMKDIFCVHSTRRARDSAFRFDLVFFRSPGG